VEPDTKVTLSKGRLRKRKIRRACLGAFPPQTVIWGKRRVFEDRPGSMLENKIAGDYLMERGNCAGEE